MTQAFYKFTAYNSQAQYAFGTEAQAEWFCDRINAKREINVYGYRAMTPEEIAEEKIEERNDVVNLDDEEADSHRA